MELSDFFAQHPKAALAFSGGADSAFLLYSAAACGADIMPYFVRSQFQPAFERADARRLAAALGVPLRELEVDVLCEDTIAANPADRCYFCKRRIFGAICTAAAADGYPVVLDGTNASDDRGDRPGMRALEQARVLSPLRLCGLTKAEVRRRSKAAGLFTWDKPTYACLATRVPTGEPITAEKLRAVERSESFLFALGFTDLRVRLRDGGALLQLPAAQHAAARALWPQITAGLSEYFSTIELDPKARAESE